jgi:transposase
LDQLEVGRVGQQSQGKVLLADAGGPQTIDQRSRELGTDELRERLRKMTDAELLRFGQGCKHMCSAKVNFGRPRDLRQLLWHWHRLVQMRTRIMNQLQALAMNEGYRWKKKLFSEQGRAQLEKLVLAPWASRRRQELLELLDRMNPTIEELTSAVEQEAKKRPEVLRLMTHPGVGPLTALAYVLIIGTPTRFQRGKQIGTYVGMIPCEDSSAHKQRLGHISKQGNSLLRFLC